MSRIALQSAWADALRLDADAVAREADRLAVADTLSLILCGALPAPRELGVSEGTIAVSASSYTPGSYRLDPWPFRPDEIVFETEARALPPSGRLADEAAMRSWLADPDRTIARSRLGRA